MRDYGGSSGTNFDVNYIVRRREKIIYDAPIYL